MKKSDILCSSVSSKYSEYTDKLISFISELQLKDMDLWQLTARQFGEHSDAADYGWRGEFWGKLMRGACGVYEYTHDRDLYEVLKKATYSLLEHIDEKGRIFTYDDEMEFHGWDMWSRKYVLLGLLHFYDICDDDALCTDVVNAMKGHLDYIIDKVGRGKKEICDTSEVWQGVNSVSILEPVVRLYGITNEKRYFDFAEYIVSTGGAKDFNIFETAFVDKLYPHEYTVKKAYELMSCFEGLLEYYKITGIEKWRTAVINFAKKVAESEVTIIGGAGCEHECFNNSVLMQTYTKYDGLMQETCVTVTWMKLCFRLLKLTGDSVWADYIEQSAYNALFGSVNTEGSVCPDDASFDMPYFRAVYDAHTKAHKDKNNGGQVFDSYSPLRKGVRGKAIGGFRDMDSRQQYCGCCIAIGAAGLGIIPAAAVMESDNGYAFSLYLNGDVNFNDASFNIATKYPAENSVVITVKNDCAKDISLRIPSFSKNTKVYVNDEELSCDVCGEYFNISRAWKSGDVIKLEFDMRIQMHRGLHNPDDADSEKHIAFTYGPIVLATDKRLETGDVDHICEFDVPVGDKTIKMIDYASAGKTWNRNSELAAWIFEEDLT